MHIIIEFLLFALNLLVGFAVLPSTYALIPFLAAFLYPCITEPIQIMLARNTAHLHIPFKSGFVYSQSFNIKACGLQKLHPFDSCKYEKIFSFLLENKVIKPNSHWEPQMPSRNTLSSIMTNLNLFKIKFSVFICKSLQMPLCFLPSVFLRAAVLDSMALSTQGTADAVCIATRQGWAINLSGGYHHANKQWGQGFCIYPDISLGVLQARKHGRNRVLIIDLDVHQGNGHQRDWVNDQNVIVADVYNNRIYPGDLQARKRIDFSFIVNQHSDDQQYLRQLNDMLQRVPPCDFVIYNAGTDILAGDPLGRCNISKEGVIARDEMVFRKFREKGLVMLLSGGYQKESSQTIGLSILNLMNKQLL